jgi:hypothetical protein
MTVRSCEQTFECDGMPAAIAERSSSVQVKSNGLKERPVANPVLLRSSFGCIGMSLVITSDSYDSIFV